MRKPPPTPLARALLRWYAREKRDLPWRRRPDPYRVWVSEIMLQQTTVAAAIPYYERFMERFPDLSALAEARESEVLALWSGLGYYHRARNLLEAARLVRDRHEGRVPRELSALRELPGVGPYTAGSILSIGHGIPAPALDGNIVRVGARLSGWKKSVASSEARRHLEAFVMRHMPPAQAPAFNQALMDLGATVCTPRAPLCPACPVSAWCEAFGAGQVDNIPVVPARRPPAPVILAALAVCRTKRGGDEALMARRPQGRLMGGMWEFPLAAARDARDALQVGGRMAERLGSRPAGRAGSLRHTITRHAITIHVVRATDAGDAARRARRSPGTPDRGTRGPASRLATPMSAGTVLKWMPLAEIADGSRLAVTGAARKIARLIRKEGTG